MLLERLEERHAILAARTLSKDHERLRLQQAVAFVVGGVANPLYSLFIAYLNDYLDPDDNEKSYPAVADTLPPEPKEIKPHPYGVELGILF